MFSKLATKTHVRVYEVHNRADCQHQQVLHQTAVPQHQWVITRHLSVKPLVGSAGNEIAIIAGTRPKHCYENNNYIEN